MRLKEKNMAVENGKRVTFHFTLTVDEKVIQTSEGQQPMSYTHGSGQIITGLASEIEGMNEGEEKNVTVSAENAYGKVNPDAFKEVPRSSLPDELIPQVMEESIIIDMNHPLAGKDLQFDIKVVSIE
jgi:FKBP-type peptidyl-prolyl cis-trans isomerase 2